MFMGSLRSELMGCHISIIITPTREPPTRPKCRTIGTCTAGRSATVTTITKLPTDVRASRKKVTGKVGKIQPMKV